MWIHNVGTLCNQKTMCYIFFLTRSPIVLNRTIEFLLPKIFEEKEVSCNVQNDLKHINAPYKPDQ